ncbi:DUF3173 family protein [Enterococcus rivorum]|uniref:DUF3173 domain-containing protein n=1 Tax=Enterococcus rivorum TaxID=762845 RepID=A0A1E5KXR9_9ENTE|nr:DUF3173 family protein [Enterococcus rivorum]MBP2099992.1 hypothetical protein [Enterococcus rivorum]OEH82479.1 hypothetical protein BCR26_13395 [Enterococcus rivorum]
MDTITKKEIESHGFNSAQAQRIFRNAKKYMVREKKCDFYSGRKVQRVPAYAVEKLLGMELKNG